MAQQELVPLVGDWLKLAEALEVPIIGYEGFGEDEDTAASIVRDILGAASFEDTLGGQVLGPDDVLDVILLITEWKLIRGDFEDEEGRKMPYASMTVRAEMGDDQYSDAFVLNCGGAPIVAQLLKAQQSKAFPIRVKIRRNETRAGFRTYRFVKP